ncbi:hypothetical protein [Paracoccus isoporae]|uniref:hypothetical protein n=1 Tax=Paracoccus isoporae TaxID=591205 RepID=UPI00115F7845|nr:hypothetical protein [Paracoccus isoporae]
MVQARRKPAIRLQNAKATSSQPELTNQLQRRQLAALKRNSQAQASVYFYAAAGNVAKLPEKTVCARRDFAMGHPRRAPAQNITISQMLENFLTALVFQHAERI